MKSLGTAIHVSVGDHKFLSFYLRVVEAFSLRMLNSDVRALARVFLLDA